MMQESMKTQKTQIPRLEDGRSPRALYWIIAASVLIRLVFVVFFSGFTQNELLDSERYTRVALNVIAGNGFAEWRTHPTAFVPPLYPLFLAMCYGLFGMHPMLVKIIQAVVGGLLPWTIFGIGRRLVNDRIALMASAVTAVYPELVVLTGYLYTETFFIQLECLFFLFLLDVFRAGRPKDWILSGIFLGLSMLVRSLLFYFPPFLFLACLTVKPLRKQVKGVAVMALVGYAMLIPWTVRNAVVFHRFVPMNTMGTILFWVGSDTVRRGEYRYEETRAAVDAMTAGVMSEPDKDSLLLRAAMRNIREHPLDYARLCLGRGVQYFVQIYENVPNGAARKPDRFIVLILAVSYYSLLLLGLVGFWMSRHQFFNWFPLAFLLLYTLLLFSATFFVPRYRIPMIPFWSILAAYGLAGQLKAFTGSFKRRR
jgi:4-amino-4-deoxy-L-arabinose transferase-like glycosyltransferase